MITIQAVFLVSSLTAGHKVITRTPPDITAPTITSIHCNHSNCTTHSIYNIQVTGVNHPKYLQHTGNIVDFRTTHRIYLWKQVNYQKYLHQTEIVLNAPGSFSDSTSTTCKYLRIITECLHMGIIFLF